MNRTFCKFAFAAALFGGLLGFSTASSATTISPTDTFTIAFDPTAPDTYNHVSWQLLFSEVIPFQNGKSITIEAFNSTDTLLGSQPLTQPFPGGVTNISSGFDIDPTSDLLGYIKVTSVDATFDWIGGSATLDFRETPLPAALPLFAGGLGVMGFLARRRRSESQRLIKAPDRFSERPPLWRSFFLQCIRRGCGASRHFATTQSHVRSWSNSRHRAALRAGWVAGKVTLSGRNKQNKKPFSIREKTQRGHSILGH